MVPRRTVLGSLAGLAALGAAGRAWADGMPYEESPDALYDALGQHPAVVLNAGARRVRVVFAEGAPGLDRTNVLDWVRRAIAATTSYYGVFPMAEYTLFVIAEPGDRIGHGTTWGYNGSVTRQHVGIATDKASFDDDWVLVHEMVHCAFPDLPRRALWLQEGNATWVEPVARVRAGQLPASEIWHQAIVGLPRGKAAHDEGGMDGTLEHGRLYWGGAAFWLEAEIAIFKATNGRKTLRDALIAINRESGGNTVLWTPEATMKVGDAAVGKPVLKQLYARWATTSVVIDDTQLFARLGVRRTDGRGVAYDSGAPLAAVTQRIDAGG
jgi:hypothetical protein